MLTMEAYAPGSPMLAKLLEMNGTTGVAVWGEWDDKARRVWFVAETGDSPTIGFPDRNTPHYSRKAAVKRARSLAERYGVAYRGVQA